MAETHGDTVHVYDTWVRGKKGLLHFDVMTTDEATALKLAKRYLEDLGEHGVTVTLKECQFCHSEPLVMFPAEQQKQFKEQGGFILPLPA
jgi:heterodisulfide reductase subunit B